MPDTPDTPDNFGPQPAAELPPLSPEAESEARTLIDAGLNGLITPAQHQRLEQMVIGNLSVARLYLEIVHLWCSIPLHVSRQALDLNAAKSTSRSDDPMNETMILPAVKETDLTDEDFDVLSLPTPASYPSSLPVSRRNVRWRGGAAAAILILGISVFWALRGNRTVPVPVAHPPIAAVTAKPPAMITATAAISSGQSDAPAPGTALALGEALELKDGAAEVTFASGAVAVLRGPARLRILDRNVTVLDSGEISVHVPFDARGFRITAPGLSVIDRGTNFGVRAVADGAASEVQVFLGKVDARGVDSKGQATSEVIHMVQGQAVRHDAASPAPPVPVPFSPGAFAQDIAKLNVRVPMHNTGDGASLGGADPNWQIVSVPKDPNWKPRQAMIPVSLGPMYTQIIPAGNWIAVNRTMDDQPAGLFTFQTEIDLSGFNPASVAIIATVAADDYVADIRINGASTGLSTEKQANPGFYKKTDLAIPPAFWHAGVNQVDVVVGNRPQSFSPNCMALHVDWSASGLAVVHR